MKKTIPTTEKARKMNGWHKHLKPQGKRLANKGTRKIFRTETQKALDIEVFQS